MTRLVPFKEHKVCDGCGAQGAYDFMGDYYCQACTDKTFEEAMLANEEGEE